MKIKAAALAFVSLAFSAQTFAAAGACAGYKPVGTEFKLSTLNAPAQNMSGIAFPGNQQTLFRGAYESNAQFTLDSSLKGMLGEKNWSIGSPMFFGIRQVLTGKWNLESDFFPTGGLPYKMYKYFHVRGILEDVNALLKCRAPKFYSNAEANALATDLMNKVFFNSSKAALIPRYFNIAGPGYYGGEQSALGFANNAVDFIIGTTYDQVASIYGIKTLVLKDKRNRGFDLGWWNRVNNGKFWNEWVDNGEINIPGYINSDEILGFQQRTVDRVRAGWGVGVINNGVDFAYYKLNVAGKTVVAIIDGAGDPCVIQGKDSKFYSCERNWGTITSTPIAYPFPHAEDVSARKALVGVISVCSGPGAGACDTDSSLFTSYGKISQRELPAAVIAQIQSMKINGQPVKLLLAKGSPAAKAQFSGIKVLVATFAPMADAAKSIGNVTVKAAEFANGKDSVDYKISARYLGVGDDRAANVFSIDWICGNNPKVPHHLSQPAPASYKILKISCD